MKRGLSASAAEASPAVVRFGQAAAADLRRLARLHDREPTAELLEEMRKQPLQDFLCQDFSGQNSVGANLDRPDAVQALALVAEVVADLPCPVDDASLTELAEDFAAIHRTGAYRVRPVESAWVQTETADGLAAWRLRGGVGEEDPRGAGHLVPQLRLLAGLLERDRPEDAAAFLDEHPLRWVPDFCGRVAARCRTPYFAGVALLTGAYLDQLRDRLEQAFALPRPLEDRRAGERKGAASRKPVCADPWG